MNDYRRCIRCKGRKKLYKVGTAYSMVDTGGQEVECPLCMGNGQMPTETKMKALIDESDKKKEDNQKKKGRPRKKDLSNDREKSEK